MSTDQVLTAVSRDGLVRARVADTTGVVAEALIRHLPGTLASRALGRALTAASVYPMSWKDFDRVHLQWSGRGPLGTLMAEIRKPGHLRAFATVPMAEARPGYFGRRDLGYGLLPGGFLSVLKQRPNGSFTQSQVELASGEIDEDLEHYFTLSEQTPTRVRAFVELGRDGLSVQSRGLLVQVLPGGSEELLPQATGLHEKARASDPLEIFLELAFSGRPFDIVDATQISYQCPCTRERIATGIALLQEQDLREMMAEEKPTRVRCDFCATDYVFDRADLETILRERRE